MSDEDPTPGNSDELETQAARMPRRGTRGRMMLWATAGLIIVFAVIATLLPAVRNAREAARRSHCRSNLKGLGLALQNYHEEWGSLPPAYTVDAQGNRLHSWRTLLLPFLDGHAIYNSLDLSKPWDDPVNAEVFKKGGTIFFCPSSRLQQGMTSYLGIVGPHNAFLATEGRKFEEFKDGLSNSLLVIEVDEAQAVPWMSPEDADEEMILKIWQNPDKNKKNHTGGRHSLFADGSVRFLFDRLPQETLKALITIDDGIQNLEF